MAFQVGDRVRFVRDNQDGSQFGRCGDTATVLETPAGCFSYFLSVDGNTNDDGCWYALEHELEAYVDIAAPDHYALGMALTLADILDTEYHWADFSATDIASVDGYPKVSAWLREQVRRELLGGA